MNMKMDMNRETEVDKDNQIFGNGKNFNRFDIVGSAKMLTEIRLRESPMSM
jgi:hypothetical protein